MQGRINKLEELCIREQEEHKQRAVDLESTYKVAFGYFQELDDRINYVATKVVHLGDQLEGINAPRSRALEAQELMKYFEEFEAQDDLTSKVFTDPEQIHEAANIIQKLSIIAQELPLDRCFFFEGHYTQVENNLIRQFKYAHHEGDRQKMRACADTLVPFKGYSHCIDTFIEQCQKGQFYSKNVFEAAIPLCENAHSQINDVFGSNAEIIMGKLVQNIHEGVFQKYIQSSLVNFGFDKEQSLKTLYTLYAKAKETSKNMSEYKLGSDSNFLERLRKNLFSEYLVSYISTEIYHLKEKSTIILDRYYNSINHQKKERPTGTGLLSQELQKRMPARLYTAPTEVTKETYLSQDVAVNLLQENKSALSRCELVSSQIPRNCPTNAYAIYQKLLDHLCIDHIDYALDMALQGLPPPDPRGHVDTVYFDVLDQANGIFHLLEKHFTDCIIRLVGMLPYGYSTVVAPHGHDTVTTQHGHDTVTARSRYGYDTARSQSRHSTVMIRSRHSTVTTQHGHDSTVTTQHGHDTSRYGHGTVTIRLRHSTVTVTVTTQHGHDTVTTQHCQHGHDTARSSPVYSECIRRKKECMESMESKLDTGLDRVLTSLVGYVRYILNTEQRKTDFKPEDTVNNSDYFSCTTACSKSCQFIRLQQERIRDALDGKNLEAVLTEFGTRVHRLLFEHLQQFTYSYDGGMRAICDINEYRKCMKEFK
ncbi:hypothetical protein QZH41_015392, partial [Actinostola sp. cb2023]